jgi:hypothetical protein
VAGTKAAGRAAAAGASRAKTPLIAGGVAIAGLAGGVAVKNRAGSGRRRSPGRRLAELDLDSVAAAARRVSTLGQQVADIATAVQAARDTTRD